MGGLGGLLAGLAPIGLEFLQSENASDERKEAARIRAEERTRQAQLNLENAGQRRFEIMILAGLVGAGLLAVVVIKSGG